MGLREYSGIRKAESTQGLIESLGNRVGIEEKTLQAVGYRARKSTGEIVLVDRK